MSVCVESTVVASQASTTHPNDAPPSQSQLSDPQPQPLQSEQQPQAGAPQQQQPQLPQQTTPQQTTTTVRTITKIPASNAALSKASFITVLNTPLGNVKSLCVTPAVSTGQFTVVNSAAPLSISNNPSVKPQTITLINTPVTVVKTIPPGGLQQEKNIVQDGAVTTQLATAIPMPALIENRGHNVFVKNTASCADGGMPPVVTAGQQDMVPQSHKLLTANNFPTNNVLTTAISVADVGIPKPVNGQRNKVKILQNVLMPGPSQPPGNILLNKTPSTAQLSQRYVPRQKLVASNNGATTKYLNKPPSTLMNKSNIINPTTMCSKQLMTSSMPGNSTGGMGGGPPQRVVYPTHKSQIKTIPPVNNYMHKGPPGGGGGGGGSSGGGGGGGGIKTLPPHMKGIPGAPVQRTGSGLRTIPPQRPQKPPPNKPNYIGKHAVQAQKMKPTHKPKAAKLPPQSVAHHGPPPMFNNFHSSAGPVLEKHLTFNQALTAEILETLGNGKSGANCSHPSGVKQSYEILPPRYDNSYYQAEAKPYDPIKPVIEKRTESGLDTLSLICQAVLLDHNYNATAPPRESPSRSVPPVSAQTQINGVSVSNLYSPTSAKRRSLPTSNPISAATSLTNLSSSLPSNSNSMIQEDDAASDISDDDRKHDTEGEETDTAPEAEAVNQEDQFGDYVTRCICGFLHDDGYMIECDRCKVWQHVQCVVKNKQVPDDYLCEMCDPQKSVDRSKARLMQQQWLRDRQFADPKLRKESKLKEVFNKHKESVSDSDTSDGELVGGHNNNVMGKSRAVLPNRRKNDTHPKGNNARQRRDSVKEPTVQKRQPKKRERKVVKRKGKAPVKNHSDDENHDSVNSSTPLPQFRQWLDQYEEATTNHYSPELRARISNIRVNGALHAELAPTTPTLDCPVEKCRVHVQPLTNIKHLYTTGSLAPNTPVVELRGKYMLSTQHRTTGSTLNTRQHAQRPGPFVFFYRLHKENTEVCVDTRTYGNSARFIRRSCKPNAELRHSIVKSALHLYIVTIADVDKNVELTIKHESHDLAAIGTTHIACACGNSDECTVNKSTIKKNGDTTEMHKKRRGRRTISTSAELEPSVAPTNTKVKRADSLPSPVPTSPVKPAETVDVKIEIVEEPVVAVVSKVEPEVVDVVMKSEKEEMLEEIEENKDTMEENKPLVELKEIKEEDEKMSPRPSLSPTPSQVSTRRSSHKADKDDSKESDSGREASSTESNKNKNKKLSREERKLEAILRAIEQMEKADQRKQEHQAKQAHRRESEPTSTPSSKEDDKLGEPKVKRRRRKGRARTTSTTTPTSGRRNRLNSTDSYLTSGDETMLSPRDGTPPSRPSLMKDHRHQSDVGDKDVGLLLALSNGGAGDKNKSPHRDGDSNSNSNSVQSSPETHLSSACLLVQAAVEPMEPGFKFPKTKKGLMNEWLNKAPEPVQSASSISPSSLTPHINTSSNSEYESNFYTPGKSLVALAQVASFCDTNLQPRGGSAKKRWLRQAISEDQCDSPSGRPDSPTLSDSVAPPKKRRLPRESLSNDNTPPTTPTSVIPVTNTNERQQSQEGCVEIVYSGADDDSPSQTLESDAVLEERAAEMKEEFAKFQPPPPPSLLKPPSMSTPTSELVTAVGCLSDPRLARDHHHPHHLFTNSEHLVGTVEKTLSILGFEDRKPEAITPAKRKLSITEYRQRKKINNNDKNIEEQEQEMEQVGPDESNSSESTKQQQSLRPRSNSTSSCTSMTSSDDEAAPLELVGKAPSAFNSEPTELERQREITSMRLKKAFGITLPQEPKKPALDVDAILNCEIPPMVKTIPPCPNFPIPGSCDGNLTKASALSPSLDSTASPGRSPAVVGNVPSAAAALEPEQTLPMVVPVAKVPVVAAVAQQIGETEARIAERKLMFYTPDEEEVTAKKSQLVVQGELEEATVDYVPPFNNPIYPNDSNFNAFTSSIDEEGRYEGRNPSPPPELETGGGATFHEQET